MKRLGIIFLLLYSFANAEFEISNFIGIEYKSYIKKQNKKDSYNLGLTYQNEMKYFFEDTKIYSKIEVLKDLNDKKRDYLHIDELYYSKSFDSFDFDIGKKTIFLGTLEANNLVDIFNRQNYQKDSLSNYKNGSIMANVNYFMEDDSILRFYIKAFEEDIKMPSKNSVYYPFTNKEYSEHIDFSNKKETPSILTTYTKSYDEDISADVSFGFFYGYDNNIIFKDNSQFLNPYLFLSSKLLTYNTFVIDSTLYKIEGSYTKTNDKEKIRIDDFYQLGVGLEYTFEQIYKNHNLGLITEYYKSDNHNISFDNDLFLALRYTLNDSASSEFLAAYVQDIKKDDNSVYMKYNGRLTDNLNISTDLRYIKSSTYIDEHLRFGCEIKYYF